MLVLLAPPESPLSGAPTRGVILSIVMHLAGLALIAPTARQTLPSQGTTQVPELVIVRVAALPNAAPISSGAPLLNPEEESALWGKKEDVDLDTTRFDIAKIRHRKFLLFPFLTADLQFLEYFRETVRTAESRLLNPYTAAARNASRLPPLAMGEPRLQQTIDRAWSRRERWHTFGEIAAIVRRHHPSDGRAPDLLRAYLDRNILQPFCDSRFKDPLFWVMLENASEHADFIDFVHSFVKDHPSSRTGTELLFLLDELAQGSCDALLTMLSTHPEIDLTKTSTSNTASFELAVTLRQHYSEWLSRRGLSSLDAIAAHYADVRLRLLSTIVDVTPDRYREADARFLIGQILFEQGKVTEAVRSWRSIEADRSDSYATDYMRLLAELQLSEEVDLPRVTRILDGVFERWRVFSIDRLLAFGYSCDRF